MKKYKLIKNNYIQILDGNMIGGFSLTAQSLAQSSSSIVKNPGCKITNNCNGGNCVAGCGGNG